MSFFASLLLVVPAADVEAPKKGRAVRQPEVRGCLAAPVRFPGKAGRRVADAALDLLASCHHVSAGDPPDWDDTLLDCMNKRLYVHIRFLGPQKVRTHAETEKVRVSEMILVLREGIWVRQGDRAKWYSKYGHGEVARLQRALKGAEPAE